MASPLNLSGHTHQSSTVQVTLVNPWGHPTCAKEQNLSHTTWLLISPALFQHSPWTLLEVEEKSSLSSLHYILLEGSLSYLACTSMSNSFSTKLFSFSFIAFTSTLWKTETWSKGRSETNLSHRHHTILRMASLLWWLRLVTWSSCHP